MIDDSIDDIGLKKDTVMRVLVIDDNPDILEIVSRSLNGTEFYVIGASNGRQGIQIAKEQKPDIILLDITMPGFDGFMTGKVIKRNQGTKGIPIIYLSGRKTKQDITMAIQTGGVDYIVKPFSPHDLLTRIRRALNVREAEQKRAISQRINPSVTNQDVFSESDTLSQDIKSFVRYGDVIVCPLLTPTLVIDNFSIYRGLFANIVSDGFLKVVFDAGSIEKIDGTGLGLLISINESLKSYSGSVKIVLPKNEIFHQVLYVKLNDIFDCFDSVQMAVDSYSANEYRDDIDEQSGLHNVCMVCANINDVDSLYCKYCGSNLVIGKGIKILDVIRRVISHTITQEIRSANSKICTKKESIIDENIPSEFLIELTDGPVMIQYKAQLSEAGHFKSNNEIGIQAPFIRNSAIPVQPGMTITMGNTHAGSIMTYETVITAVDSKNGILFVRYTDEAKILHSQKNFSVALRCPITLRITCPSFNYTGGIIEAKILELNRVRMVVFSDQPIPEKECLSISFYLPGEFEVCASLVIAKKRKEKFMYDIEFAVIDEREQTKIVQFMYKRQIELAKGLEK